MGDSDFRKYVSGEYIEDENTRVIVGIDNLLEEANLIIEQNNTRVTLTVFVSPRQLMFRTKDYKNINFKAKDSTTAVMLNGGLKGVECYKDGVHDEIATEQWVNPSFETIWEEGKASTQFWIGNIWVGVKNIKGIEVFMTIEDEV